jgi:uncharacterized membrane protein YqgA involved in biofilm formation
MHFWGFIVNTITVIVGSLLGLFIGSKLTDSIKKIILTGLGLSTILIGVQMTSSARNVIMIVGSLLLGGILGQLIGIEEWLESIGERIKNKFEQKAGKHIADGSGTFVLGFVTASVLFCAGPMTIIGSLQDGFSRQGDLIYIKSLLDGVAAIALTASMGIGVIFSAVTVLIIQGLLTYAGIWMGGSLAKEIVDQISATGGAMMLGLAVNLLGIGRIKVGNFMPALLVVALLARWLL